MYCEQLCGRFERPKASKVKLMPDIQEEKRINITLDDIYKRKINYYELMDKTPFGSAAYQLGYYQLSSVLAMMELSYPDVFKKALDDFENKLCDKCEAYDKYAEKEAAKFDDIDNECYVSEEEIPF